MPLPRKVLHLCVLKSQIKELTPPIAFSSLERCRYCIRGRLGVRQLNKKLQASPLPEQPLLLPENQGWPAAWQKLEPVEKQCDKFFCMLAIQQALTHLKIQHTRGLNVQCQESFRVRKNVDIAVVQLQKEEQSKRQKFYPCYCPLCGLFIVQLLKPCTFWDLDWHINSLLEGLSAFLKTSNESLFENLRTVSIVLL